MDDQFMAQELGWRWLVAFGLYMCAFLAMLAGVSFSERPDVLTAGIATKAFYSLGIFVLGGLDLGTPQGGPWLGRAALWLAYFAGPLLTASAVIEATFRLIAPNRWQLQRVKDHIVVNGSDELTLWYLNQLRKQLPDVEVVVVQEQADELREQQLKHKYDVTVVVADITQEFVLDSLRLNLARKILLLGQDDFQCYEAASKMISRYPEVAPRIVLHCRRLRFLHDMQDTRVAQQCTIFNIYQVAAIGLVREHLIGHFKRTVQLDVVVIAGFGRFGQSLLEELLHLAPDEIATLVIIDIDAERRIMVAEEQGRLGSGYNRVDVEGDIAHPEVWQRLAKSVDLARGEPVVILGTGHTDENLRTALWIRRQFPMALIFVRSNQRSELIAQVGADQRIHGISLAQLLEDNLPVDWMA